MANRYWRGGSGTWDTTTTTNWSTSSGGSGGASVPTAADSVFFDQAGTYTVTMTGALTCLDFTVSAGTVTFTQVTAPSLAISGSLSLLAGTVWSTQAGITFNSSTTGKTVTTNGVSIGSSNGVSFSGTGGWTLGSALTLGAAGSLSVLQGTFDTGNYNVTTSGFSTSGTGVKVINLGSSTISSTTPGNSLSLLGTNQTINTGTSTINCQGTILGAAANTTGQTFYNVNLTANSGTSGTYTVQGINTFNNLTVTGPVSAGTVQISFTDRQTINGTLSTTGTAGNRRVFFASSTYGIGQTLTINGGESLTDADFRDIYVIGTAAPATGTRIGNRGNCRGITFSTPKTVYWNLAGAQNWSANGWATTSTGTPSTDNFPLPQDTATFTNAGSVTGTISLDSAIAYIGSVDMSGRTSAMTLAIGTTTTVYGNWVNGSGTTISTINTLIFSGGGTQTITSAGKAFTGQITVDTYGGTVQLADALNTGTSAVNVNNGTFDTKNYSVTSGTLSSTNSNPRTINLGSSTLTINGTVTFTTSTNLTFNAGTSTINNGTGGNPVFAGGNQTFYNVNFTNAASTVTFTGVNTFNNVSVTAPASAGITPFIFSTNQIVNGTLTVAGAAANQRIFLYSDTLGTTRTLTVNSLSASDCDFRDITIAGAAAGTAPTRAGDCGGNSGITFPAPKTVYWNLAGSVNWSATGWATSSGGTPAVNNFPLAQDTAVFDNTGLIGTVTFNTAWNVGTFDASLRTSAAQFNTSNTFNVYGNWLWGTGCTSLSSSPAIVFTKRGTQTITSNGVAFGCAITANAFGGKVQLADALTLGSTRTLTVSAGEFDAVTYNVTTGLFTNSGSTTLRMGTGTWTLSGTGNVWNISTAPSLFYKGTANIVLSDTSTTARTFTGNALSYNKLTIGGTTGTSTLTFGGAGSQFTELASTKTVAHTITFQTSTTHTVGKWSITGTSGNVVTLAPSVAATTYTMFIAGPATSGIDYLSVSYCAVSITTAGEFYVGANSTNTAGNTGPIFFTATPSPRTLYWVGGTGNWTDTTHWSTSSGGASGAAVPTSLDSVNFNSASNATAYSMTVNTQGRCAGFNMAGPASGNVTFGQAGGSLSIHGNFVLSATGIANSLFNTSMTFSGNGSGTITTNGVTLANSIIINGVGATWTLGGALNIGSNSITVTNGAFDTAGYALTLGNISMSVANVVSLSLGASTVTSSSSGSMINFQNGSATTVPTDLTFNAGTSTIVCSALPSIYGAGKTFYNLSFTTTSAGNISIYGANTFNNFSSTGITASGLKNITIYANQTINGTLTLSAGTNATMRHFVYSDTLGTTRTLTCAAVSATDVDFRDITIAGAAAPISGTRLGDCKGNSGITFPAAKTVYWNLATGGNWSATGWATTGGGTPDVNNFPLAQDTAIFQSTGLNSATTITLSASYNIGTIDMSARTSNTMTFSTGNTTPSIYGNWINGTGVTPSGTGNITFAGRGNQTITSAGKTWLQAVTVTSPGGTVSLQDAFTINAGFTLLAGTFDAVTYNFTSTSSGSTQVYTAGTIPRTLAIGSGTWAVASTGSPAWSINSIVNLSVTGTGTISMTAASSKVFAGGGISYSGITLNQGGAGTLTISGNNTFKDITNTYSATGATTIALGTTTQTVTQWSATGASGKVLSVTGLSAASPGTLIYTGSGRATVSGTDYLLIQNVKAYPVTTTWYAGANGTNNGSLGWYFEAGAITYAVYITEAGTAADSITAPGSTYKATLVEYNSLTDTASAKLTVTGAVAESATLADTVSALRTTLAAIVEGTTVQDALQAYATMGGSVTEGITALATFVGANVGYPTVSESAQASETVNPRVSTYPVVSEQAQAAEQSAVAPSTFSAIAQAVATLTGTPLALAVFPAVVPTQGASIADQYAGAYLWNDIDDSQTPNWQNINNSQSTGWVEINDDQTPNWQSDTN